MASFGALLLALVAGCSHQASPVSLAADTGLYFNEDGGTASLAYGRANSDSVGLMLQCQAGSGVVEVSDNARSEAADLLVLGAGKSRSDLPARVDFSTGQPTLWARTVADAPAFKAFRASGAIRVSSRGGNYTVAARPKERRGVERFFNVCGRA